MHPLRPSRRGFRYAPSGDRRFLGQSETFDTAADLRWPQGIEPHARRIGGGARYRGNDGCLLGGGRCNSVRSEDNLLRLFFGLPQVREILIAHQVSSLDLAAGIVIIPAEAGAMTNPTWKTLANYAAAVGRRAVLDSGARRKGGWIGKLKAPAIERPNIRK